MVGDLGVLILYLIFICFVLYSVSDEVLLVFSECLLYRKPKFGHFHILVRVSVILLLFLLEHDLEFFFIFNNLVLELLNFLCIVTIEFNHTFENDNDLFVALGGVVVVALGLVDFSLLR